MGLWNTKVVLNFLACLLHVMTLKSRKKRRQMHDKVIFFSFLYRWEMHENLPQICTLKDELGNQLVLSRWT